MSWTKDRKRHKIVSYGCNCRKTFTNNVMQFSPGKTRSMPVAPKRSFSYSDNMSRARENGIWLESKLKEKLQGIEGVSDVYLDDWGEYSGRLIVKLNFKKSRLGDGYYNEDNIPLRKISSRINAVCRAYNEEKASLVGSCGIAYKPKKVYEYDPYTGKPYTKNAPYDKDYYIIDYEI